MKKYLPLLLIAVVLIALNVSEKNQPQNNLLISGIAVEEGEDAKFKFTLSIMEGEEEDLKYTFKTCEADSVTQAVKKISDTEGKREAFSMCRWLIFSQQVKADTQDEILQQFIDNREVTPKLLIFESDAQVIEYLSENEVDTQKIIALAKEEAQTLPDYVNDGKINNTLVMEPEGIKVISD